MPVAGQCLNLDLVRALLPKRTAVQQHRCHQIWTATVAASPCISPPFRLKVSRLPGGMIQCHFLRVWQVYCPMV